MRWSGSGLSAPPASAIDCLCNGISSCPCFLLAVLFGLTALPFVIALSWRGACRCGLSWVMVTNNSYDLGVTANTLQDIPPWPGDNGKAHYTTLQSQRSKDLPG
jgi:hypothetical protein